MICINELTPGIPRYQLKITLRGSRPAIWRRFVVAAGIPLHRLHTVIQRVMGWTDSHLHLFKVGSAHYGIPDWETGLEIHQERHYALHEIAPGPGKKFIYEYDFGDGWEHTVAVEQELPPDAAFKHPLCLGGERACPPEDCGGISGYHEFLTAMGDPQHEEHADMKRWIGGAWDPKRFDLQLINRRLKQLKA